MGFFLFYRNIDDNEQKAFILMSSFDVGVRASVNKHFTSQDTYLLFRFHRLELPFGVLPDGTASPELPAHQRVAHDHYQHRDAVRQDEEHQVVAVGGERWEMS